MSRPTGAEELLAYLNRPFSDDQGHSDHDRLKKRVMWQARRLNSISTLYLTATAEYLSLNLSDLLCIGILSVAGPITPGQLATLIGLSTGSVTGLVDRLERLDLVRRERDEEDRRRIVLHLNADRVQEVGKAFVPMLEASWQHLQQFTEDELRVIARYTEGGIGFMQEATRAMRSREKTPAADPTDA